MINIIGINIAFAGCPYGVHMLSVGRSNSYRTVEMMSRELFHDARVLQPSKETETKDFLTVYFKLSSAFLLDHNNDMTVCTCPSGHISRDRMNILFGGTIERIQKRDYVLYATQGRVYEVDSALANSVKQHVKLHATEMFVRTPDLEKRNIKNIPLRQHKNRNAAGTAFTRMQPDLQVYRVDLIQRGYGMKCVEKDMFDTVRQKTNTERPAKRVSGILLEAMIPDKETIRTQLSQSVRAKYPTYSLMSKTGAAEAYTSLANPNQDSEYERGSYPVQETSADGPSMFATDGYSSTPLRNITYALETEYSPRRRSSSIPSRHPAFIDEDRRLSTYPGNWSYNKDPSILAACGLFYSGRNDLVTCFSCGVGFKNWSPGDDPWFEHMRLSPDCQFPQRALSPDVFEAYKAQLTEGAIRNQQSTQQFHCQTVHQQASYTPHHTAQRSGPQQPDSLLGSRYPKYAVEIIRMSSFTKWPKRHPTPQSLAEAGLFYTGVNDGVRCFHCNGGMRNWDDVDEPWVEHARWFPNCEFVKRTKGEEYIRLVQLAAREEDEQGAQANGISTGLGNLALNQPRDTPPARESENPIYSPAAQSVLSMGFSRNAVTLAIDQCNRQRKQWNAEILANILYDKLDRGEVLPVDTPRSQSPVQLANPTSVEEIALQNEKMRRQFMCIMCEENESDMLFLPCGHLRMCSACADDVSLCPLCGTTVKEKIKTYKP